MVKAKGKPVVGLDIGSRYVKAIEISPVAGGDFAIRAYAYRPIDPKENLKDLLKDLFHTAAFSTKKVVTGVSGRSVITRYITMPEMSDVELKNAIKYEASKYIPFEADEVILDCQRMDYATKTGEEPQPATTSKEMRVVLVAAKKNLVDEHLNALEGAGLWPLVIDLDTFAVGNAFELHELLAQTKGTPEPGKSVALIDIGSAKTSLNIVHNTNSYFTREITIAGNDVTEAFAKRSGLDNAQAEVIKCQPDTKIEEVKDATSSLVDDLVHEIKLSFDYFEHQFEQTIDAVYLSGGSSALVGLSEILEKELGKKLVKWSPVEYLQIGSEKINQDELKRLTSQFAVAIGLASRIRKP